MVPDPQHQTVLSKRLPLGSESPLPRIPATPFELGKVLEGEKLGHFLLTEFVGGGGMGAVFRAQDEMLGRTVAVKVLSGSQTDDDTLRRFQNEAQSAARLDHPNIARVHYVGDDRGYHYIVFEFIEGTNVRDLVESRGPLPIEDVVRFGLQIADALDHAFGREVVHRDIKPSNLLVMPDGHIKLVDMGLARLHQVEASGADLTASGVTLGTFDYISPEQARDPRSADVRSDLYSLGCTLYYMLSGRPPFPEGTVLQKLLSHSSDKPTDVRELRPDVPGSLAEILHRLLAKQPMERYQTPSELIGALLSFAEDAGYRELTNGTRTWVTNPARQARLEMLLPWLIPVALLLAIAVLIRQGTPESPMLITAPATAPQTSSAGNAGAKMSPVEVPRSPPAKEEPDDHPAAFSDRSSDERATSSPMTSPTGSSTNSPTTSPTGSTTNSPTGSPTGSPTNSPTNSPTGSPASAPTAGASPESLPPAIDRTDSESTLRLDQPRRLVVDQNAEPALIGDTQTVATWDEAVRLFQQYRTVERLELAVDGELPAGNLEINGRTLQIAAAAGRTPRLVFRGSTRNERHPIHLAAGRYLWDGIEFVFDVSESLNEFSSLFLLDATTSLELRNCTITLLGGSRTAPFVSCVQFAPRRAAERMPSDDGMSEPMPPTLELAASVVRGYGTLVRVPDAMPLRVRWEQGLLITSERMLEYTGSRIRPRAANGIRLELANVTAVMGKGLALLRVDREHRFPFEFSTDLRGCIIACRTNTPESTDVAPLIELRGDPGGEGTRPRPYVYSRNSYFPLLATVLRIDPGMSINDVRELAYFERNNLRELDWEEDGNPVAMVKWKGLPPISTPIDQRFKQDYLLDEMSLVETAHAGFDPVSLPPARTDSDEPSKDDNAAPD